MSEMAVIDQKLTVQTLSKMVGGPTLPNRYQSVGDCIAVILAGKELGIPEMTALRELYMVNGEFAMSGKLQLALILRRGHRVHVVISPDGAKVTAQRWDPVAREHYDAGEFTFTEEDAKRAKLTEKIPYKRHPQNMYGWRAIGLASRFAFPDCTSGFLLPSELDIEDPSEEYGIPDAVFVEDINEPLDELVTADELEGGDDI